MVFLSGGYHRTLTRKVRDYLFVAAKEDHLNVCVLGAEQIVGNASRCAPQDEVAINFT